MAAHPCIGCCRTGSDRKLYPILLAKLQRRRDPDINHRHSRDHQFQLDQGYFAASDFGTLDFSLRNSSGNRRTMRSNGNCRRRRCLQMLQFQKAKGLAPLYHDRWSFCRFLDRNRCPRFIRYIFHGRASQVLFSLAAHRCIHIGHQCPSDNSYTGFSGNRLCWIISSPKPQSASTAPIIRSCTDRTYVRCCIYFVYPPLPLDRSLHLLYTPKVINYMVVPTHLLPCCHPWIFHVASSWFGTSFDR